MEKTIEDFRTGDVLRVRSITAPYVYHHVGVVLIDENGAFVYHNTPGVVNEFGGGVVRESLSAWIKLRALIKVERTGVSAEQIRKVVDQVKQEKYNATYFNCEHFVKMIVAGKKESRQLQVLVLIIAVLFYKLGKWYR